MSQSCPLLFRQVDGTVARINAFNVTVLLILFLSIHSIVPIYVLMVDFFIKLFVGKRYSPLSVFSGFLRRLLRFESVMVDAGAKRLAAYFGLLFSFILIIAFHADSVVALYAVSALFISCTFLEVMFNYCVGCKIYYIIMMIFPKFKV
jgi:hypothetical protein